MTDDAALAAELAACDHTDYGRIGSFTAERRFIHEHIIRQRHIEFGLPTNNRAIYYVGKDKAWPNDADGLLALFADYDARDEKRPTQPRKISQKVSDWINWLIDHGLVGEDEIVDELSTWYGRTGVNDLLLYLHDQARRVALNPWSPNPIPIILCEGRNDMSMISPVADANWCRAFPLGGMRGGSTLRWLAERVPPTAPIGYVGDHNKGGFDIEAAAERFLRARGWAGTWTRIAITDAQAVGLPHDMKIDKRLKIAVPLPSIETAAMGPAAIRAAIQTWLDGVRPDEPDATEEGRSEVVRSLRDLVLARARGAAVHEDDDEDDD